MKKTLWIGLLLCGMSTLLPAQQKDTVKVYRQQLPKISKITVSGQAQVMLKSAGQNMLSIQTNCKTIEPASMKEKELILDQPCRYELSLADTSIRILAADTALVKVSGMSRWPFYTVDLKNNAALVVENQDTLKADRMNVVLQHNAVMRVKSPFYLNRLEVLATSTSQYTVETDAYDIKRYTIHIIGSSKEHLANSGYVKFNSVPAQDTFPSTDDSMDIKQFFKELGNSLSEFSAIREGRRIKVHPISIATPRPFRHWQLEVGAQWAFLAYHEDISSFSNQFNGLSTPSDNHISFSSLALEVAENYRFNKHHALKMGIGLAWDNYRFKQLTNDALTDPLFNYSTKFKITYVTAPLGYNYNNGKHFGFSLEVIPGYAANGYANLKKTVKTDIYKNTVKNKVNDMSNVNLLKLDGRASVKFPWGAVFVQPSLLPVLDNNGDKKLYPVRFGFSIIDF